MSAPEHWATRRGRTSCMIVNSSPEHFSPSWDPRPTPLPRGGEGGERSKPGEGGCVGCRRRPSPNPSLAGRGVTRGTLPTGFAPGATAGLSSSTVLSGLSSSVLLMCVFICGCQREPTVADDRAGQMVYVDLKTKQPVIAAAVDEAPAIHPATGGRTLMPALYCPTCQRWYPSPPLDQLQRKSGAAICPKDKTPLTTEGPWPD